MASRLNNTLWAAALLLTASLGAYAQAVPDIRHYTTANLKTLQFTSEIVNENQTELKKISGDIALAYRLHRGSVKYDQPDRLRIEATIPHLVSGVYIINGDQKKTIAPFYNVTENVAGSPGKKQTLMDFGLISPEMFNEYNITYLRTERGLLVFQTLPKIKTEPLKDIIWINPTTHITVQRYNYNRDGKLLKWFLYKDPVQEAPGIWIPTRVELYNTENKLAGATLYQNIIVNQPLDDSLFKI